MSGSIREELLNVLLSVLPSEPGIAVLHSSISELLPPPKFSRWDALYALDCLVKRGWTVALPAFTFSFCKGTLFSARQSPSETGILADWLLAHFPDARRTPHPIYSFAVRGPRSEGILACTSGTTFGDDSPFGLFEREGATIVMLGCSWEFNTQFHRYEELARVPYRHRKLFSGNADFGAGPKSVEAAMWVRNLSVEPVNNFSPAIEGLRKDSLIKSKSLWRGLAESVAAGDLARVCKRQLAEDPYAYVANGRQAAKALSWESESMAQPPLKIAVLGSSNLHLLEVAWLRELSSLLPERRVENYTLPFGQMRQALLNPVSELRTFAPAVRVFCDRLEDLAGERWMDVGYTEKQIMEYAEQIINLYKATGGWSIVHRFAAIEVGSDSTLETSVVAAMNTLLDEILSPLPQIAWVNLSAEAAAYGGAVLDHRLWHIGRFPYSDGFSRHLARCWAGLTLAIVGKSARLVVVDLDNTLWGGVLGEDGLSGIQIGGDYPGNAFAAFQRFLKSLPQRGIALAISSKNDEDMVIKALDELPSNILRSSDFTARRIGWQPKWQSIQEIADELNLGLDSVLFIDDNPVERESVRLNLPGVKILELPSDPDLYVRTLQTSPYLGAVAVSAEDRQRIANFNATKQRNIARSQTTSLEDYLLGLEMKLHFNPLNSGNAPRAVQLCQKTNQFNTTTRRYDMRSLEKLKESGADVVIIGLADKHSPLENIGLIILKPEEKKIGSIDLFLLSCRVLGRGIETAVPRWAVGRAARHGWKHLRGSVIETERNTPVRKVFAESGFKEDGSGVWSISTSHQLNTPKWFTIVDQESHK